MKPTTLLSLGLTAGLICMQPLAVFAADQDPNAKKELKAVPGKGAVQAQHVQHGPAGVQGQNNAVHPQFHKGANPVAPKTAVVNQPNNFAVQKKAVVQSPQAINVQKNHTGNHFNNPNNTTQVQNNVQVRNHTQFVPPQGNRANHYGGHWFAASVHPDWGNSGEHYWNHHHYRWYDGGWVIYDAGYAPGYATGGSISSAVQSRLSDQGYYNGPIDGDIGPGSRQAIANYQGDHGLRPTGNINDRLLDSLGLQ